MYDVLFGRRGGESAVCDLMQGSMVNSKVSVRDALGRLLAVRRCMNLLRRFVLSSEGADVEVSSVNRFQVTWPVQRLVYALSLD